MITLSKIAELAHVSVSTASKAFAGSNEVNEQTRKIIFDIAKQHNCFKKYYNVKYPKYVIAVIAPEFHSRLYSMYLTLLQAELAKYNCEICVAATNFSGRIEADLLDYYTKYANVDGIICIGHATSLETEISLPIATIGKSGVGDDVIKVRGNLEEALDEAVKHFKNKGITDIGYVGESLTCGTLEAFKTILHQNQIDINDDFISITDKRFEEGGYDAAERFFERGKLPRFILAAYDNMAFGAMHCITEHGIKIPEDVAIMGLNDNAESKYTNPPLTSVNFALEESCRVIVRELLNKITDKDVKYDNFVPYTIKFRKSTEI